MTCALEAAAPRAHRQAANSSFCEPPECNGGPAGGTLRLKIVGFYDQVEHAKLVGRFQLSHAWLLGLLSSFSFHFFAWLVQFKCCTLTLAERSGLQFTFTAHCFSETIPLKLGFTLQPRCSAFWDARRRSSSVTSPLAKTLEVFKRPLKSLSKGPSARTRHTSSCSRHDNFQVYNRIHPEFAKYGSFSAYANLHNQIMYPLSVSPENFLPAISEKWSKKWHVCLFFVCFTCSAKVEKLVR